MARLGKRVLRPGGHETTRWLLAHAKIGGEDDVVELAPGLGITARAIVARGPRSYVGIERDQDARAVATRTVARSGHPDARILGGDAVKVPLPNGSVSLVLGEAMLSMQSAAKKRAIVAEAHRVLRPSGRYAIHELALRPEDIDPALYERIQAELSASIHVGVRIGTVPDWQHWLEEAGFVAESVTTAPMRLLEPDRLVQDEGLLGTLRFLWNALRTPGAVARLRHVRRVFRKHQAHLCAVAIVARRAP
jgi:SAM-dependent methyltransferase